VPLATCRHVEFAVKRPWLAPVPFYQNPAIPPVNPAMRYPVGMRTWRLFPPSRGPDVGVAIPTMLPGNPYVVTTGWWRPPLDHCMWRPDPNYNIGGAGAESQRTHKNQSHQSFKNHKYPFLSSILLAFTWRVRATVSRTGRAPRVYRTRASIAGWRSRSRSPFPPREQATRPDIAARVAGIRQSFVLRCASRHTIPLRRVCWLCFPRGLRSLSNPCESRTQRHEGSLPSRGRGRPLVPLSGKLSNRAAMLRYSRTGCG